MLNPATDKTQPSEYTKALKLKHKLDIAIRNRELANTAHNIRATVDGKESRKSFAKSTGKSIVVGATGGAAVGGIASVPLSLLSKGFRGLRYKPVGMAVVGTSTVLGGGALGVKRLKEGRRPIQVRYQDPGLTYLKGLREELKNTESPAYKAYIKNNKPLSRKIDV